MLSAILRRLKERGRAASIATVMGVSEATVSRLQSDGTLEKVCAVLAHCGLKVVPVEDVTIAPEKMQALITLSTDALGRMSAGEMDGDL